MEDRQLIEAQAEIDLNDDESTLELFLIHTLANHITKGEYIAVDAYIATTKLPAFARFATWVRFYCDDVDMSEALINRNFDIDLAYAAARGYSKFLYELRGY